MSIEDHRRAAGIAANLASASDNQPDYAEAARSALAACVRSGRPFTADDLHRAIPTGIEPDRSHNVVPSLLGASAAAGVIRRIGAAHSARPSRHSSRNALWIAAAEPEEASS